MENLSDIPNIAEMEFPIEQRLGHHIKRVEQELAAAKDAALRPLGLTVPQYTVMLVLSEEPGLTGAALARRCFVTPQTMSTVLTTLTGKGLVERHFHQVHHHVNENRLSRKGQGLLRKADLMASRIEGELNAGFTVEELSSFREFLARCSKTLQPE